MNTLDEASGVDTNLSVTRLFNDLKSSNWSAAAQELWSYVQKRLIQLSRKEVGWSRSAAYDEEDVALSAFNALCQARHDGKYDQVADRDEIWKLLAVIAINKARKSAARENRICRGGRMGRVEDASSFLTAFVSDDPGPEFHLTMQEECQRLLNLLDKRELQMVALLKVEGHTNEEMARMLGCTRRAVQRRLALIRDIWAEEAE